VVLLRCLLVLVVIDDDARGSGLVDKPLHQRMTQAQEHQKNGSCAKSEWSGSKIS
jgi:hypothetical protein